MTPSATNALAALRERLRQRGLWAGALAVPGLGIPVLVGFALPGEGAPTLERSLWLLSVLPLVFLSPLPWQWTEHRARLGSWKRALPLNLAGGALASLAFTVLILFLVYPAEDVQPLFFRRIGLAAGAVTLASVGLGWPVANLQRLWAQLRAADDQARTLQWMRHRSPFPPTLLVRHLRRLSTQAEDEPATAEEGILRLAHLYRTWLALTEQPLASLEAEKDLLESFFAAESHRTGETVRATWEGWSSFGAQRLPTFGLFSVCAALLETGARDFAFTARERATDLEIRLECRDLPEGLRLDPAQGRASWQRFQDAFGERASLIWESPSTLRLSLPRTGA